MFNTYNLKRYLHYYYCSLFQQQQETVSVKAIGNNKASPGSLQANSESDTDQLVHLLQETIDELKGH